MGGEVQAAFGLPWIAAPIAAASCVTGAPWSFTCARGVIVASGTAPRSAVAELVDRACEPRVVAISERHVDGCCMRVASSPIGSVSKRK